MTATLESVTVADLRAGDIVRGIVDRRIVTGAPVVIRSIGQPRRADGSRPYLSTARRRVTYSIVGTGTTGWRDVDASRGVTVQRGYAVTFEGVERAPGFPVWDSGEESTLFTGTRAQCVAYWREHIGPDYRTIGCHDATAYPAIGAATEGGRVLYVLYVIGRGTLRIVEREQ